MDVGALGHKSKRQSEADLARVVSCFRRARNNGSLQNRPERVNDAGNPEQEAEHHVDDGAFAGTGLEINGQRRDEQRDDGEDNLIHAVKPRSGGKIWQQGNLAAQSGLGGFSKWLCRFSFLLAPDFSPVVRGRQTGQPLQRLWA
jgi:hypothetical protein